MKVLYVLLLGFLPAAPLLAALPLEVTVTKPTQFELMRDGHPKGSISLEPGAKLEVIDLADDYLLVRYRNANGRVRVSCTDLSPDTMNDEPAQPAEKPKTVTKPPPAAVPPAPVPPPPHVAANALERALAGKLVHLEGGALRSFDGRGWPG
jgi:hypothetical protein